jgi:hypothetical protein
MGAIPGIAEQFLFPARRGLCQELHTATAGSRTVFISDQSAMVLRCTALRSKIHTKMVSHYTNVSRSSEALAAMYQEKKGELVRQYNAEARPHIQCVELVNRLAKLERKRALHKSVSLDMAALSQLSAENAEIDELMHQNTLKKLPIQKK